MKHKNSTRLKEPYHQRMHASRMGQQDALMDPSLRKHLSHTNHRAVAKLPGTAALQLGGVQHRGPSCATTFISSTPFATAPSYQTKNVSVSSRTNLCFEVQSRLKASAPKVQGARAPAIVTGRPAPPKFRPKPVPRPCQLKKLSIVVMPSSSSNSATVVASQLANKLHVRAPTPLILKGAS